MYEALLSKLPLIIFPNFALDTFPTSDTLQKREILYIKSYKILGTLKAGLSNATNFLLNNLTGIFTVEDS